jgi:precorrin-6A/cobalt-precorrin-6A reductase
VILLLAGTTEARKMAWLLHDYGIEAVASLAGETASPAAYPIPTRIGGFGGEDGFVQYLDENGITAVIDATHPFATAITERTARVCAQRGLSYIQLIRAEWEPEPEDKWIMVPDMASVSAVIPDGTRVFAAVGRKGAAELNLPNCHLVIRTVDPQPAEDGATYITGRPPFPEADEVELLKQHEIDIVVAKNAGGMTEGKLLAARQLGIPVVMVQRPPMPDALRRERVQDVLDWVMDL